MAERKIIVLGDDGETHWKTVTGPFPRTRKLVNCEAYDAIKVDGGGEVQPQCHHPQKNGGQPSFGCELIEELPDGSTRRLKDAVCPFQVRRNRAGSAELAQKIDDMNRIRL